MTIPALERPDLSVLKKEHGFKSSWNLSEGHSFLVMTELYDVQKLGTEIAEFPQYVKRYFEALRTLYYHIDPLMSDEANQRSIGTRGYDKLFALLDKQIETYYRRKQRDGSLLPQPVILENLHIIRRGLIREMALANLYFTKDYSKDKLKDLFNAKKSVFEGVYNE